MATQTLPDDCDNPKRIRPHKPRPFPLEPLAALFPPELLHGPHGEGKRHLGWQPPVYRGPLPQIAQAAGVSERLLYRARAAGGLTAAQADLIACRIGLHPALIWGELWSEAS